jgi:hypothetical protein
MAKRRKINKSQHIRDYLESDPTATPKVIKEALKAKGITVTDSLVSLVKYKSGSRRKTRRRGRVARAAPNAISFDDLVSVKAIAQRMGGLERAKQALGMLERLQ